MRGHRAVAPRPAVIHWDLGAWARRRSRPIKEPPGAPHAPRDAFLLERRVTKCPAEGPSGRVARQPRQPRRIRRPTAAIRSSVSSSEVPLGTAVDHAVSSVVVEQAERHWWRSRPLPRTAEAAVTGRAPFVVPIDAPPADPRRLAVHHPPTGRCGPPAPSCARMAPRPSPSRSVRRDAAHPPQGCRCSRARRPSECDSEVKVPPPPPR